MNMTLFFFLKKIVRSVHTFLGRVLALFKVIAFEGRFHLFDHLLPITVTTTGGSSPARRLSLRLRSGGSPSPTEALVA